MWVAIEGYKFPYRVDENANVQKQKKNGDWVSLTPHMSCSVAVVDMRCQDGKQRHVTLSSIMDKAFFGGVAKKNGLRMRHKNGSKMDCSVWNLEPVTRREMGVRAAAMREKRIPVVRVWNGVETLYKSKTDAAAKNGMSRSVLEKRIKGHTFDQKGRKFFTLESRRGRPKSAPA